MTYKPGSVPPPKRLMMAIHLGWLLPTTSSNLPGHRYRIVPVAQGNACPYMVLLRMGFTMPVLLPVRRCALTAPFHPYRHIRFRHPAVCFLLHFPPSHLDRALPGILILWSQDFPLPLPKQGQQPSSHLTEANYTLAIPAWSSKHHGQYLGGFGLCNRFGFFSGGQPCIFLFSFVGLQGRQLISQLVKFSRIG